MNNVETGRTEHLISIKQAEGQVEMWRSVTPRPTSLEITK